tara:strand:- start:22553 stop:22909 length:357 start_codon:yes stop_codon:yes gene_type:complete
MEHELNEITVEQQKSMDRYEEKMKAMKKREGIIQEMILAQFGVDLGERIKIMEEYDYAGTTTIDGENPEEALYYRALITHETGRYAVQFIYQGREYTLDNLIDYTVTVYEDENVINWQ